MHGMARLAYDDDRVYANGAAAELGHAERDAIAALCATRRAGRHFARAGLQELSRWLLGRGIFEIPRSVDPM